ncbi:MAG: AzlC family ABC transporter permease [Methylocystaceae bacterium]|nr:AzlC family ABC transporter permease [Methylocystaceae bacterium]
MTALSDTANHTNDFQLGALRIMPIALSCIPFGMALGALAVQKGFSPLEIVLMGMTVFAGAAQFIAVDIWSDTISPLTLVGIVVMVNLRLVLMSISIAPALRARKSFATYFVLHFMTDEVWAICMQRRSEKALSLSFFLGAGLTLFLVWAISSYSGAMIGTVMEDPTTYGIDFAGTAVFLTLLCGFWEGCKISLLPWLIAAVVAVLAYKLIDGPWYILCGAISAMVVRAMQYQEREDAVHV